MHVILSLKLGDHEGLTFFIHDWLLKRTLLVVLPEILIPIPIPIPIRAFLSPVPVYCGVQSGTSWCCLAAAGRTPAPRHPTPGNSVSEFCIFCIISLIINVISVISKSFYIQFVSLSLFSSFSLPLVGWWVLTESICHSVYCPPDLNSDIYLTRGAIFYFPNQSRTSHQCEDHAFI